MRALFLAIVASLVIPTAASTHIPDCVPTSADPSTYYTIATPLGTYYVIHDENGVPTGSTYQETNDVPELQRGGVGLFGDWFPPGCDQQWEPGSLTVPCLIISEDPIMDETCGHGGPDMIIT